MSSIQEVKAGLARVMAHGGATIQEIRAARDMLEEIVSDVRVLGAGTGHPHIDAAVKACEQSLEQLHEVSNLTYGANEAARNYGDRLG